MDNLLDREKEVLKQAIASFEDDVKACADFYYLSPVPKTAQEIREQCLFIGREEEIANTKEVQPDFMEKKNTFFAPRKIRVVGCVNCPYYSPKKVIKWKEDTAHEETMEAKCNHPSFRHSIEFLRNGGLCEPMPGNPPNFIPDWCPLEFEICNVCAE